MDESPAVIVVNDRVFDLKIKSAFSLFARDCDLSSVVGTYLLAIF